jgi:hypothetical protein
VVSERSHWKFHFHAPIVEPRSMHRPNWRSNHCALKPVVLRWENNGQPSLQSQRIDKFGASFRAMPPPSRLFLQTSTQLLSTASNGRLVGGDRCNKNTRCLGGGGGWSRGRLHSRTVKGTGPTIAPLRAAMNGIGTNAVADRTVATSSARSWRSSWS